MVFSIRLFIIGFDRSKACRESLYRNRYVRYFIFLLLLIPLLGYIEKKLACYNGYTEDREEEMLAWVEDTSFENTYKYPYSESDHMYDHKNETKI